MCHIMDSKVVVLVVSSFLELWKIIFGFNEVQQIMIFGPEACVNQFTVFRSEVHGPCVS